MHSSQQSPSQGSPPSQGSLSSDRTSSSRPNSARDMVQQYLDSLDRDVTKQTYSFQNLVGDELTFCVTLGDLKTLFRDGGLQFNTVKFWRSIISRYCEVPVHLVGLSQMGPVSKKFSEALYTKSALDDADVFPGGDDSGPQASQGRLGSARASTEDFMCSDDWSAIEKQVLSGGGKKLRNHSVEFDGSPVFKLRSSLRSIDETNVRPVNQSIVSCDDVELQDAPLSDPIDPTLGDPLFPAAGSSFTEGPQDIVRRNARPEEYHREEDPYTISDDDSELSEDEAAVWTVTKNNDEPDDLGDAELDFGAHRYRVVFSADGCVITERKDLTRIKWHKLNALGLKRCEEFFYLEKYRDHVDYVKSINSNYHSLLLSPKLHIIGMQNIEKALCYYPSHVDGSLYDCLTIEYPYEIGTWNRAEFYRLCSENPCLAMAIVRHPSVVIPDRILNVIDPTHCTMFNHQAMGSEELGLLILEKYQHVLSKPMLNAVVHCYRTTCLTRAIVGRQGELAMALLNLCDKNGKSMLTLELIEQDCWQGYAVYHREFGREFQFLQDFREIHGRWPQALDMANVLGLREVEARIETKIAELRKRR